MRNEQFFNHQKLRIAKISISTSAFRGQGKKGLIKNTRAYIRDNVSLADFANSLKNGTYEKFLDRTTEKLLKAVSSHGCKWGTARKGLNIYFRDILYNSYFYKELKLSFKHGMLLEIPLDSKTMGQIVKHFKELNLEVDFTKPKITRIIKLDKANTALFQVAATEIAKKKYRGYTRVDLDMEFWAEDKA